MVLKAQCGATKAEQLHTGWVAVREYEQKGRGLKKHAMFSQYSGHSKHMVTGL